MIMTSFPSLRSGKCWLQFRGKQPDVQAHGDRANVLADADTEGTSQQGHSQGYGHGHPRVTSHLTEVPKQGNRKLPVPHLLPPKDRR